MNKLITSSLLLLVLVLSISCSSGGGDSGSSGWGYTLLAWNDLGMHCMDKDYSIFAILPPYNNLHAQLVDRDTGKAVTSGVTLTYEATADPTGSINSTSAGKTNFWDWVGILFGATPPVNIGLTGNPVQGEVPAAMTYDSVLGFWKADGIPTIPRDDLGNTNYYPMVKVVARDTTGSLLASTKTVLPISDEMTCVHCHASNTGDPAALPAARWAGDPGWVNDPDSEKDWKRNILKLHDDRNLANPVYTDVLATIGYMGTGLLDTADAGHPILCANCHASNALGKPGITGIKALTASIHEWHAVKAMDDNTGMPLDQTLDRSCCFYCHPGSVTQCLRGAMGKATDAAGNLLLQCQSCHETMSQVGAVTRAGWKDLPSCQNCHYLSEATGAYVRDTSGLDAAGNFRQGAGVFSTGASLYKLSAEHGQIQCEACHGSTHAEYPSSEPNDNVQSVLVQGYEGTIRECSACHDPVPLTRDRGPHGLHTIGAAWVSSHGPLVQPATYCTICHGADYKGTFLSRTSTDRSLMSRDGIAKNFPKAHPVSCFDCHMTKTW